MYFNAQPTPRVPPEVKQKPSNALVSATATFTGSVVDCMVDMTEEVRVRKYGHRPVLIAVSGPRACSYSVATLRS